MRLPDNQRVQRRFRADAEVKQIAAYLTSKGVDMQQHSIMRSFPKKVGSHVKTYSVIAKVMAAVVCMHTVEPVCRSCRNGRLVCYKA